MDRAPANSDWWPNQLNLRVSTSAPPAADPMGEDFDYAKEFKSLDLNAVIKDLQAVMTDSQDWWPADFGHYGPSLHPHGVAQRRHIPHRTMAAAAPDTASSALRRSTAGRTTRASTRRAGCLWPIKQKYGRKISWADLMILTGNVALESMGFKTFGFGGGRVDVWEPEDTIYWGPEGEWLADERYFGDRELHASLARCRWASSTSIRKGRTASRTRSRRPGTSARRSGAWR